MAEKKRAPFVESMPEEEEWNALLERPSKRIKRLDRRIAALEKMTSSEHQRKRG